MGCYTIWVVREADGTVWWDGHKWGQATFDGADELLTHLDGLQHHPVTADMQLDAAWCRGWFVDRGRRLARGYLCGPYATPVPIDWPGWDVAWEPEGPYDVADRAGLRCAADPVGHRLDDWQDTATARLLTRHPEPDAFPHRWDPDMRTLAFDWYFHQGTDLSVVDADGTVRDYGFDDPFVLFAALGHGPDLLDVLAHEVPCPYPSAAWCGAVLDVTARTIRYWTPERVSSTTRAELEHRWPGWSFTREPDGAEGHLRRTGRRLDAEGSVVPIDGTPLGFVTVRTEVVPP